MLKICWSWELTTKNCNNSCQLKRERLKDLSNIALSAKRKQHATKDDLSKCVDMLCKNYNYSVDISTDEDDTFCGLFVQDYEMEETFTAFPAILFLDATYKPLDLQFPEYLFVCEDSNGASEIIRMGMLVTEEKSKNRKIQH